MSNATQTDSIVHINKQLSSQTLSFAPLAWLKLLHVMYLQKQTVAFTGVRRSPQDLLYVEDVELPMQRSHGSVVQFNAQASVPSSSTELGSRVIIFAGSPNLRTADAFSYGRTRGWDWWVVVHVSRSAQPSGWLIYNSGPQAKIAVLVQVDWRRLPHDLLDCEGHLGSIVRSWMEQHAQHVRLT